MVLKSNVATLCDHRIVIMPLGHFVGYCLLSEKLNPNVSPQTKARGAHDHARFKTLLEKETISAQRR
ncbi:hypothetical protein VH564_08925 [Rhizobium sp. HT1-10]